MLTFVWCLFTGIIIRNIFIFTHLYKTAIASMQAITSRYGHSPLAFLLVPITGAFLIDITNALLLQGFLTFPWFGF